MKLLLSTSSKFHLTPNILVCTSISDIYTHINNLTIEEKTDLSIFVDEMFITKEVLSELELLRFEFEEFNIIIDDIYEPLLKSLTKMINLYNKTKPSEKANLLFANVQDLDDNSEYVLNDLKRGLENPTVLRNLVEFDFNTVYKSIDFLMNKNNVILEENLKLKKNKIENDKQISMLLETLDKLMSKYSEIEHSFKDLVEESLKLKYKSFLDDLSSKPAITSTTLAYFKCIIPTNEAVLIEFFKTLNSFIRNKYNFNSTLIVINDFNRMKLSKIVQGFTYISSEGKYNPSKFLENIMTTSHHVNSIIENLEAFSGLKDIYIVLDISCSTKSFIIGSGTYFSIINNNVADGILNNLQDLKTIEESSLLEVCHGEGINLSFNITRSEIFKHLEQQIRELITQ